MGHGMTRDRAGKAIAHVSDLSQGGPLDPFLRITLNFHPDRITGGISGGVPILRALAHDGVYRSQFETGSSNGGLTAHPEGERWLWERRIFDGAYDDAPAAERPKYGALNHRERPVGAAPRFGSAHLRLAEGVLGRSTFCYPDSFFEPMHFGTANQFDLDVRADADVAAGITDRLDDYVEAQVHGVIDLAVDVEAIVLDPCFRGTEVEQLAAALPFPTEWHPGFSLDVDTLAAHADYRGPEFVALGNRISDHGHLDPAVIGRALATGAHDPQSIKRVWHYVARFGTTY